VSYPMIQQYVMDVNWTKII